jgi:predicted phosphate transport protein (TIGR00153 family)
MLRWLLPKKTGFFELFSRHAELGVEAAQLLQQLLADLAKAEELANRIRAVEHEADKVCQQTMEMLHRSFITPIDRGDIHRISSRLDDVLDNIEATSQCLWLYEIRTELPEVREMSANLLAATEALKRVVESLSTRIDAERTRALCAEVKEVEKRNDRLLRGATARLFREASEPRSIVMWKEIYVNIEEAIDRCEDVANVIEGVVLENA